MPCTYYLPGEELALSRTETDKVTRILCHVVGQLERLKDGGALLKSLLRNEELALWYKEHKKRDRLRSAQEEAYKAEQLDRKIALKKLTARERKLLGILG